MTAQALGLQGAIYSALASNSGVDALVGDRIYDAVPRQPVYPYVTIGNVQAVDDSADCTDGEEAFVQINVYTRSVGLVEAKQIGGALKDALHDQPLAMPTGLRLLSIRFRDAGYRTEPDGLTGRGIIQFVALTESG